MQFKKPASTDGWFIKTNIQCGQTPSHCALCQRGRPLTHRLAASHSDRAGTARTLCLVSCVDADCSGCGNCFTASALPFRNYTETHTLHTCSQTVEAAVHILVKVIKYEVDLGFFGSFFFFPPTMSLFFLLSLSPSLSSLTAILFFYKPHIQSPGYRAVTVATRSTSHHLGARSYVVTWPPVFTGLDGGFGTCLLTHHWSEQEASSLSLSFSLTLFLFIPFSLRCVPFFSPEPPQPHSSPSPVLASPANTGIVLPRQSGFSFDTSSLIDCVSGKRKICIWIGVGSVSFQLQLLRIRNTCSNFGREQL